MTFGSSCFPSIQQEIQWGRVMDGMAWQGGGTALSLDESCVSSIQAEVRPAKAHAVTRTELGVQGTVQRRAPSEAQPPQDSFGFMEQASARGWEQLLAVPWFSQTGRGQHGGGAATAAACTIEGCVLASTGCVCTEPLGSQRNPIARGGTRGSSWPGRGVVLDLDNGEPQLWEKTAPDKNLAPSDGEEGASLCRESACGPLGTVAVILAAAAFQTDPFGCPVPSIQATGRLGVKWQLGSCVKAFPGSAH